MTAARNVQLDELLRRAGLSHGATARHVNARGRAAGINMAVDTTRVTRWVRGEHPRSPVPGLLLAVLSERLGVPLTLADIGMNHAGSDPLHLGWPARDMAGSLHQFAGGDLVSRRDLMQLAAGAPLVTATDRLWQLTPAQPAATPAGSVGEHQVTAIEELSCQLRTLDDAHGGALFRRATVGHLDTVTGLLQARHPPALQRRLHAVAADLASLAGWTSHDAGLHATAQRYWAYAIALARAAGQPGRAAEIMTRLSHQMIYLGRYPDALDLLDIAARPASASGSLRLQSMINAQRGRVHAALGRSRQCQSDLDRAADQLDRAGAAGEPVPAWIAYYTPAELAGAAATSRRDLAVLHGIRIGRASTAFRSALELRGAGYERVRAMDLIGLAAAYLDEDTPEEAAAIAGQALDEAERLDSALIRARVLTLLNAAARHAPNPQIKELLDRAHAWPMQGVRPA